MTMEKTCPCCEKHCFQNQLRCRRGREHFGIIPSKIDMPNHADVADEKGIVLLRKCGHFLHHSVSRYDDTSSLLKALTAEEKNTLETLLEKCLQSWDAKNI
ncbi:MAG: hypothetical protein ACI4K9_08790 [Candidatus Fimenecus sp.]